MISDCVSRSEVFIQLVEPKNPLFGACASSAATKPAMFSPRSLKCGAKRPNGLSRGTWHQRFTSSSL
jgi:hypothetical protein